MIKYNDPPSPRNIPQHLLHLRIILPLHPLTIREALHTCRTLEELEPVLIKGIFSLLATDVLDLNLLRLFDCVLVGDCAFGCQAEVDVERGAVGGGDGEVHVGKDGVGCGHCCWCC